MSNRAPSLSIVLISTLVSLASWTPAAGQLHQGPAQGTSPPGQVTDTNDFPAMPTAYPELAPRPPKHRIALLPDPAVLRPPLAPLGANEQDDISWLIPRTPAAPAPGLLSQFEGILQTPTIPPDPIMVAGPSHLLALVNRDFAIFTKDGVNLQQISAPSWFSNVQPANNAFDPKVIYDHFEDRWVMVWLAVNDSISHILVSVSDDSDPRGGWCNWAFRGDFNGSTKVDNWADYEGVGFDESAVYVVPNQFVFGGGFAYVKIRILPKVTLYDAACPAVTYTDLWDLRDPDNPGNRIFTVRPAVTFGSPGVEYLINDSPFSSGTTMTLWSLANALSPNPMLTAINVPVTQRRPPPDADQLGGSSIEIDVGGPRVRNLVYRDGSVWTAHSVADVSGVYARARYVRIDVTGPTALEDVSFGRDGCWLYYPAITADVSGNMVMVYNQSCIDEYIGIHYTGRRPTDSALQPSELLKAGEANYVKDYGTGRNRWGDYNGIAVDPADPTRVWMFAEYAGSPDNTWGTWIGEVIAGRVSGDVNSDGLVNVGDVVLLVDLILERATPDPVTESIADCNRDLSLNVGDIVCLVDVILGGGQPTLAASRAPSTVDPPSARAKLSFEPVAGGRDRTVLLEADLSDGAAALQVRLAYDGNRAILTVPELTGRAKGFELAVEDRGSELLLLIYDLGGRSLAGSGPIVRIPVRAVGPGDSDADLGLKLERVLVGGRRGSVAPAEISQATLVSIPVEFRLSHPYPNPLARGSGTKLELEIPEATRPAFSGGGGGAALGPVRVIADVYNVRGQRVRELIDAQLAAGRHTLEWDGRNDRGEFVGAGLYVLRLRAGEFAATRKLIVSGR